MTTCTEISGLRNTSFDPTNTCRFWTDVEMKYKQKFQSVIGAVQYISLEVETNLLFSKSEQLNY